MLCLGGHGRGSGIRFGVEIDAYRRRRVYAESEVGGGGHDMLYHGALYPFVGIPVGGGGEAVYLQRQTGVGGVKQSDKYGLILCYFGIIADI